MSDNYDKINSADLAEKKEPTPGKDMLGCVQALLALGMIGYGIYILISF